MPRRSGGMRPAARSRPAPVKTAPRRSSSSVPARKPQTASPKTSSSNSSTQSKSSQSSQSNQPQTSGGGTGFLGTMFATAAGSAAGHVVGRSVMNAFEGGSDDQNIQQEEYDNVPQQSEFIGENERVFTDSNHSNDVCPMERKTVINCLNNSTDCQWAIDMLNKCKQMSQTKPTGEKYARY